MATSYYTRNYKDRWILQVYMDHPRSIHSQKPFPKSKIRMCACIPLAGWILSKSGPNKHAIDPIVIRFGPLATRGLCSVRLRKFGVYAELRKGVVSHYLISWGKRVNVYVRQIEKNTPIYYRGRWKISRVYRVTMSYAQKPSRQIKIW